MSEPFTHHRYSHMDEEFYQYTFPFGSEYLSEGHLFATYGSHDATSAILRWPADASTQAQAAHLRTASYPLSSFPQPSTFCIASAPLHATSNSSPHGSYCTSSDSGFRDSPYAIHTVTAPAQNGHGLIDAHNYPRELPFGWSDNNYISNYSPTDLPHSPPTDPAVFDGGPSDNLSGPLFQRRPLRSTGVYQAVSPSNFLASPTPSGNSNFESYPSSGLYMDNSACAESPSERAHPTSIRLPITPAIDLCYTFLVLLEDVEFPSSYGNDEETHFFQCRWENCKKWITSERSAVEGHLKRIHNVVVAKNNNSGRSVRCAWTGCQSGSLKSGITRHLFIHLGLTVMCSACKGPYSRTDSMRAHARRVARCKFADPIDQPSPKAYRIASFKGSTVIMSKVTRP